ncbi:hypothetical protein O181_014179 [Austropuccinia psidii MF-1]|uniref:Uncharacterized protein n=1 Tax=Austropuccinia psidii MF-1 TaxID=1389203 RepID=A0A9Q3BXP2_9BASI|nr:hypothetical protein [Austropuccinia psidii MF-1]
MSFNDNQNYYAQRPSSLSDSNISRTIKQQTQKLLELEKKLNSREKTLESLLSKFNIQEEGTSRATSSEKGKSKHINSTLNSEQPVQQRNSPLNSLARTSKIPSMIPHKAGTTIPKTISTPSPLQKRNPHQLMNINIPEGFHPTKVRILLALIIKYLPNFSD